MKRRWLKWALLLALPFGLVLFILFIHPILAITQPSGSRVAVVEGWLPPDQLADAARLIREHGYTQVYTTGTIRPFAYYLQVNEGIDVVLREEVMGTVEVHAAGQEGAQVMLTSDRDTLVTWTLSTGMRIFTQALPHPTRHLRLTSLNPAHPEAKTPNVFTMRFEVNGHDVHLLQREILLVAADGALRKAWPTYAHFAAKELHAAGLPEEMIHAVPTWGKPDSRSWANAATFGFFARDRHITAFDVITLGVHARRTRRLFVRGCAEGTTVGVISVPDPRCRKEDWWKHWKGWFYVLKEVAGSSEPYAVDLTH